MVNLLLFFQASGPRTWPTKCASNIFLLKWCVIHPKIKKKQPTNQTNKQPNHQPTNQPTNQTNKQTNKHKNTISELVNLILLVCEIGQFFAEIAPGAITATVMRSE